VITSPYTIYVGYVRFHSKPPTLYWWLAYGSHLITVKTELCTVTSLVQMYSSECRDGRSRWKKGTWPCQWTGIRNTAMGQVPVENSIVHTCGEWMEVEWTTGSSANEWGFLPSKIWQNLTHLQADQHRESELAHKCESVAKINDTQVAKLWSNEHVQ
jgi:hypothetical protein